MEEILVGKHSRLDTGVIQKFKVENIINFQTDIEGITMVLPKACLEKLSTAVGTRFFLQNGLELKGVSEFEIKPTNSDSVLQISITFPLMKVAYAE